MEFSEFTLTLGNSGLEKKIIKENLPELKKVMLMNYPFINGGAKEVKFIPFLSEELFAMIV